MITSETRVTPQRLAALFRENFPTLDKEVLVIMAEEIIKQHPKLATFIERVITSDKSNPGRDAAMKILGNNLYEVGHVAVSYRNKDEVPQNLNFVRERATGWWRAKERTDLIRKWALVNAAQELGVDPDTLLGSREEAYCERFHDRHLVPFITGKNIFEDAWSDEFYTDEYWRGLAVLSAINDWFDEKESYAFVQWAGKKENVRAIAEEGYKRRTIDIEVLSEAVGIGSLEPAISRGVL